MRSLSLKLAILIAIGGLSPAMAQHADVVPYSNNGKIVTGGHNDVTLEDTIELRVFGYDFGEDPLDPYFIGDPGFNNGAFAIGIFPNDGLLPANFTLGFNVLSTLNFWDGDGAVAFAAASAGVSLGLQRGSNTVTVSGAGQSGTVPTIQGTGAAGRVHVHLGSLLNSTDGINPNLPNAPEGIYMLSMELKLPDSGLANSDPIYFVYNNGLDEEVHDQAMDWVQENLVVPEPSTWAIMAIGAVALAAIAMRKRGRKRQAVA